MGVEREDGSRGTERSLISSSLFHCRGLVKTCSSAIDILVPSNLERSKHLRFLETRAIENLASSVFCSLVNMCVCVCVEIFLCTCVCVYMCVYISDICTF